MFKVTEKVYKHTWASTLEELAWMDCYRSQIYIHSIEYDSVIPLVASEISLGFGCRKSYGKGASKESFSQILHKYCLLIYWTLQNTQALEGNCGRSILSHYNSDGNRERIIQQISFLPNCWIGFIFTTKEPTLSLIQYWSL